MSRKGEGNIKKGREKGVKLHLNYWARITTNVQRDYARTPSTRYHMYYSVHYLVLHVGTYRGGEGTTPVTTVCPEDR